MRAASETDTAHAVPEVAQVQAASEATSAQAASETRGGMFRSLRNHNYRLFAVGGVVSNVGSWMQRTAQDWLVLDLTGGSATALGVTTALQFLPSLLFGLWGGMLADRYPKRPLLIAAQTLMGVLALTMGVLTVTGAAQVWHVWAMALALGLISCVEVPTRQSFVVEMVGRKDLPNAIALNASSFNLARVAGPALAGVLIHALGGTGPIFLVNALSFAGVIGGLALMRSSQLTTPEPVPRAKGQLREGLRYVLERPELLMPILLVAFVSMFSQSFTMSIALMARQVFGAGASSFGLASSMFAVGALAGALMAARRTRPSRRLLVGGAVSFGLFQIATGMAPWYPFYLLLLVPTGVALISVNTSANAGVQLAASPEMRGRVMGIYMLVFTGGAPIGAPLLGWISELGGPRAGVVIGGALTVIGVGAAIMLTRVIGRRSHAAVRGVAAAAAGAR
ncbi:MFS family permease [Streptosporangium becharense]|uniref:MFS family permease n=1 Tax=Streptosporangium becharense TaxID=1816182 RepID=A0A7W9II56_9ACTN|nr:MFS transporter [Streptosporangium becharense]MBB2914734.1 MFS family permease [Streptosporangium becharense]MBB5820865.1 MFS family permease [Streptosporangium becharense]